mgnify:CR=1 FL=1
MSREDKTFINDIGGRQLFSIREQCYKRLRIMEKPRKSRYVSVIQTNYSLLTFVSQTPQKSNERMNTVYIWGDISDSFLHQWPITQTL